MKLSKNNLRRALYALADEMIAGSSDFSEKAINALKDDALEIEGYIKADWIKFDPDDETTYPPKGRFIAYGAFEDRPSRVFFGFNYDNESTKEAYGGILKHWMHTPQPPQED